MSAETVKEPMTIAELINLPEFKIGSKAERQRKVLERRLFTVRWVARGLAVIFVVVSVINYLLSLNHSLLPDSSSLVLIALAIVMIGTNWLSRSGNSEALAAIADYTVIILYIILIPLVSLTNETIEVNKPLEAAYLIAPLLAAVFGLRRQGVILVTILAYVVLLGTAFALQEINKNSVQQIYHVSPIYAVAWLAVFCVASLSAFVFAERIMQNNRELEQQSDRLADLLSALKNTTEFGMTLSHELASVTAELNATAREYSTNGQEQVAAVTEVTTSLEELSETATQIALSASAATEAAERTVAVATEVRESSEVARSSVEQGTQAVEETVASVERVRNRIELLGQRLLTLTEQTRRVGTIIDLIDEIADETHLLALNASIEAAGNIGSGGTTEAVYHNGRTALRGERFGVIAQEIKNLADRSRESTEEVRQAISEMQGAVAAAVLVAEEGKKDTVAAYTRSQISGFVIDKLNEVISNSASRAEAILVATEEVQTRCDEIRVATGQQRSANQQILLTMRGVSEISQETFGSVAELSEAIGRVNQQIDQLNTVLGQSNRSVNAITG